MFVPPSNNTVQVRIPFLLKTDFSHLISHFENPFKCFSPRRTFPNCKFGDKCLFVHPNCKYDARCSKPDCPFTHVSRRSSAAVVPRPGILSLPLRFSTSCAGRLLPAPTHLCNSDASVRSSAASEDHKRVSLLPRVQKCRLSVLSPKGKKMGI